MSTIPETLSMDMFASNYLKQFELKASKIKHYFFMCTHLTGHKIGDRFLVIDML